MAKSKQSEPLVGEKLLKKVKELENLSKEDKAKACGYYSVTKNGVERVNMIQFLNALISAEGIELDATPSIQGRGGRGGRTANYRTSVQSNGNIIIGAAYTKELGLQPGDEFDLSLGRKHIYLKKVESDDAVA